MSNNVIKFQKPVVTKIRHIGVLNETAIYGAMYRNVYLPLVNGELSIPNRNNLRFKYNDKEFVVRVDLAYTKSPASDNATFMQYFREDVETFVTEFCQKANLLREAGINLFKNITDCDDINQAIQLRNSFKKDGVAIISNKVTRGEEEVMEYTVSSEFGNYKFTTNDVEEIFIFLGSLARSFSAAIKQPDPRWFGGNGVGTIGAGFPF